jgi:hypothetical protein
MASITDSAEAMKSNDYATPENSTTGKHAAAHDRKEALMRMIAQEMVSPLVDDDNEAEDDEIVLRQLQERLTAQREKNRRARRKAKRNSKKANKLNGIEDPLVSPTPTASSRSDLADLYSSRAAVSSGILDDEIEVGVKDDSSFAEGCLDDLVDDEHRSRSRSSVLSSEADKQYGSGSFAETKSTGTDSKDTTSRELSVDEVRKFVMENIPQAVREQIPEASWSQIFQSQSKGPKTRASKQGSLETIRKNPEEAPVDIILVEEEADDIVDDMSCGSDVSDLTSAFLDGKGIETKRECLAHIKPHIAPSSSKDSSHSRSHLSLEASEENPSTGHEASCRRSSLVATSDTGRRLSQMSGGLKRVVLFDRVEVRHYERVLTDNPSVQNGPAIGIGWRYKRGGSVNVNDWERTRGVPRKACNLVLPRNAREKIVKDAGSTPKEVADMIRITLRVKNQRKQTVNNLPSAGAEEKAENARRRISSLLSFGRSNNQF